MFHLSEIRSKIKLVGRDFNIVVRDDETGDDFFGSAGMRVSGKGTLPGIVFIDMAS